MWRHSFGSRRKKACTSSCGPAPTPAPSGISEAFRRGFSPIRTSCLRSADEKFLGPAERWLNRLGRELAPLQLTRGGPIIAVQVENEYGSFGNDKNYMNRVLAALKNAGLGEVLLYTADGGDELPAGTLPGIHAVVNFGPGEAKAEFAKLQKFRPGQPMMSGEYWDGWFDHWGEKHQTTNVAQQAQELDWILSQGYSINLYMFHGGTSFGFMNGANWEKALRARRHQL